MKFATVIVCACLIISIEAAGSVTSHLGITDKLRLKNVFSESIKSKDVAQLYYGAVGFKYLSEGVTSPQTVCKVILDASNVATISTEQAYYIASTHKLLTCSSPLPATLSKLFNNIISVDTSSVVDIYHAVFGLKSLGQTVPEATRTKLVKTLQALLKKEDSLSNLGYTFHIASEFGANGQFAADRIEDAIVQADEVDGKMLQFEGGLTITSLILSGSLKLSKSLNKPPLITKGQSIKFATYLMSRRSVQTPKGAAVLLEALTALADTTEISPACISLGGSAQISSENPTVVVRVCDLLGRSLNLAADSIVAQSATRLGQDVVVLSKQKFTADARDKTLFILDLLKVKPEKGMYKIVLSAGTNTGNIMVKVLGRVSVKSLEVGVGDADQAAPAKKQTVSYPSTLNTVLEADSQQRLLIKVNLVDENSKPITVHQSFVKFYNKESKQEIIFVAEQDSTQVYKFEMDVGAKSAEFAHNSGLYSIELIVGDAVLANPFKWHVADINLKFSQELSAPEPAGTRGPRSEIIHQFRVPETRPSKIVSDLFTGLCAAPLLILLGLWAKLKVNVSNFPFSIGALGFHSGLGAILSLFGVFWLQLDMFQTLRYLLGLGLVTFICGHRLLRGIASQRKGSSS